MFPYCRSQQWQSTLTWSQRSSAWVRTIWLSAWTTVPGSTCSVRKVSFHKDPHSPWVGVTKSVCLVHLYSSTLFFRIIEALFLAHQIHVWQVRVTAVLQQPCGDTCQVWMWFSKSNQWFHKSRYMNTMYIIKGEINSLWPSDAMWRYRSGSTLAQVMACCLTAPSHYLTLCWLIFSKVLWLSSESSLEIL